jgi:phage recombination protein Bet
MSNVVQYDAGFKYTQEQIDLIKSQIAKGATDDELKMFTTLAEKYGLDPMLKEIWFIKQAKKTQINGKWEYKRTKTGEIDYTGADTLIYTSRDGYLKIAQRDENFKGIISMAVHEGDHFEIDAEHYKVTHKFGLKRGKIIGAWSKVDHAKRSPVIVFVNFSEYYSEKSTTWKQYPTAMIIKVAEVFALKRQFGISGLVTREEMSHTIQDEPEIIDITPKKITIAQAQRLFSIAKNEELVRNIVSKYNYESTKDITVDDYEKIVQEIENSIKQEAS